MSGADMTRNEMNKSGDVTNKNGDGAVGLRSDACHGDEVEPTNEWTYDQANHRQVSVDYRLQGSRGRRMRKRAVRALRPLDRRLVRLAKQVVTTIAWKEHAKKSLAHQDALADQPTSLFVHIGRKVGVTLAELGFTYAALSLAGIPGRNLRLLLSIALAGLLVLLGQTIARTMKRAHLASVESRGTNTDGDGTVATAPVDPPSGWDWSLAGVSNVFLIAFATALTTLRESYNHAIEMAHSAAIASSTTQLTVAAPQHSAPGWVLAILALVAPLIAIIAEYAQYHPHAHRLRRSLRLYAWNARKLRYVLWRCNRPVYRGRRALLLFDNAQGRALLMKDVIHAAHGGTKPVEEERVLDADEPVRQLRDRITWYDRVAKLATDTLLEPHAATNRKSHPKLAELEALLTQAKHLSNGGSAPETVA
jgi:hypothetical protein